MRIVFIGTGEIGLPTLRSLLGSNDHELVGIVTQPDKPAGRAQTLTPPPVKTASSSSSVPLLQPPRINSAEAIEQIRLWEPAVIVVMAYGQIIPRTVLEIPTRACLNLHASLLPRHRGAAPIQAAIVAGDRETGITVIYMDEGLDTGDILLQRVIEILPNETGGSLHDRLAQIAPAALLEALRMLLNDTASRISQNNALATYVPKLKRENGRIDWNEPADLIERKIRAFNPWPGAFTQINGRNLKIFSASIVDLSERPGMTFVIDDGIVITTGSRALSLGEVQVEGKRRMKAAEFLRGFDLTSASCR